MLLACAVLSSAATPAPGAAPDSVAGQRGSFLLSLQLAVKLMGLSLENRDVFDQVDGGALVAKMMEVHAADAEVLCAVAAVAEMAALKVEQNKMRWEAGFCAVQSGRGERAEEGRGRGKRVGSLGVEWEKGEQSPSPATCDVDGMNFLPPPSLLFLDLLLSCFLALAA
jgi:hypothetical protein